MELFCLLRRPAICIFLALSFIALNGCAKNLVSVKSTANYVVPEDVKEMSSNRKIAYKINYFNAYLHKDDKAIYEKIATKEITKLINDFGLKHVSTGKLGKDDYMMDIDIKKENIDRGVTETLNLPGVLTLGIIPVNFSEKLYTKIKVYSNSNELLGTYADVAEWSETAGWIVGDDSEKNFKLALNNSLNKLKSDMVEDYIFVD